MKPINSAERKSAYMYFLLFFGITVIIIALAVFFGMKVPFKQNQQLQQKIGMLQNEKTFAENFSIKMAETKGILDTVNKAGIQAELLDQRITDGIKGLSAMINADTTINKKTYTDIIQNLTELQFAKKQLRDATSSNLDMTKYVQQIEGLKNELFRAQNEASTLRVQLVQISQGR
ncbi:MAG: type VI secretion system TssO [Bacteroidota bacterium]